jgi:hypothetical protein
VFAPNCELPKSRFNYGINLFFIGPKFYCRLVSWNNCKFEI